MERLPIRWRLALVSFGLIVGLFAALGILISTTVEGELLSGQAKVLGNQASLSLALFDKLGNIERPPFPANGIPQELAANLVAAARKILGTSKDVGVSIISLDGSVIASDSKETGSPVVTLQHASVQQWMTRHPLYLLTNDSRGQRELVVLWPIQVGIKQATTKQPYTIAFLQLSTSTTGVDQSVQSIRLILILGIAGALVVAAALTLPLIRGALYPLVEMERVSTRIADGALSLRLKVPKTRDEVGRLASSFNSMVTRLEATFARQKQFVADVSHELRTPLNSVHGFIDLLLQGQMGELSEEQHKYLGYAQEGVQQLVSIVEDILLMTRSDSGQFEIKQQEVDCDMLLNQVVNGLQPQALKAGVAFNQEIPAPAPILYVDPQRMKQVLNNLLTNAIKFTPPGGTVTIRVRPYNERFAMISVSDTGYGIPVEDRPHIFERFYQSNHALQSKMGGYGLGLPIAKLIVEQHGGEISFDSLIDKGTTFYFTAPLLI